MTPVCLITDDINLGHIGRVAFARLLCCKIIIFPSVAKKCSEEDTLVLLKPRRKQSVKTQVG